MTTRALLGVLLTLAACGGGTYFTTLTATPSAAPPDVIDCVKAHLGPLGYQTQSLDVQDHRLVARKIVNSASRPDRQFRRLVDRLVIELHAGADGKTAMKIEGHTFAEYETVRGPTEVEERATAEVKAAADSILQACGQ